MRTEQTLREFLASRTAANLSPTTIRWYRGQLVPFARAFPNIPTRPEPVKDFLASMSSAPKSRWRSYQALRALFRFISRQHGVPNPIEDIEPPRRPLEECQP